MDQAATSKTDLNRYLTLWQSDRKLDGFPIPNNKRDDWEWLLERIPVIGTQDFPGLKSFGARRRASSAWMAEEIFFLENILPVTVLKLIFPRYLVLKEKLNLSQTLQSNFILSPKKEVDNFIRITRSYEKALGGLSNIPNLPRRQASRRESPYIEYSVLVGDFEELVDLTLQEIV